MGRQCTNCTSSDYQKRETATAAPKKASKVSCDASIQDASPDLLSPHYDQSKIEFKSDDEEEEEDEEEVYKPKARVSPIQTDQLLPLD